MSLLSHGLRRAFTRFAFPANRASVHNANGRRKSPRYRRSALEPLEDRLLLSHGPSVVWDGGGANNNWTTAANWVGDLAPVAGDALVFAGTGVTTVNDFSGTVFESITFNDNDFKITGNTLTLDPMGGVAIRNASSLFNFIDVGIALQSASTIEINSGMLSLLGNIDNGGNPLTFDASTPQGIAISGVISGGGG